jgi:uncharacterized protein
MKSRQLHESAGQRTFALVFDKGDEVVSQLTAFAREHRISAAQVTAIGALSDAMLGYFDRERKDYRKIPVSGQVEVLALVGDIALGDGEPTVHAHVVLGRPDGTALGGHLLEARVWPTLEVVLTESPAHLRRRHDPETGLALIELESSTTGHRTA